MVKNSIAYATWRWNQRFSSRGKNLILGRSHLTTVRQTGSSMNSPSKLNTRPAPREIQTENWRPLRPASRGSDACLYLQSRQHPESTAAWRKKGKTIPSKTEQEKVDAPENEVEGQFRNSKLLLNQRGVAHLECRRSSSLFFPQQSKLLSRPATYGRLVVNLIGDDLVEK